MGLLANLFGQPLLGAGVDEIIGFIIMVVVIGFSIVNKISGVINQGKPPKRRPAQGRPEQQRNPAQARAGQAGGKSIESEIEDFLRQARGEKPQAPPARQSTPTRQPQQRTRPPAQPQPRGQKPKIIEAVPADQDFVPGKDFGRDLSEHVQEHIKQDSISTRDAGLGDYVEEADERVEQHLEEVFDHDVGHLEHIVKVDTSVSDGTDASELRQAARDEVSASAERIRKMLSTPESIREVFIASEVLKRPEI